MSKLDQATAPDWALPSHQHYLAHSSGKGYGYTHCISGGCPYVDMHQTVQYLSWWKILKYKLTTPKYEESPDE